MRDHRESMLRRRLRPGVVERQLFAAGQRMTLTGGTGDEHGVDALHREKFGLDRHDFRRDRTVLVERREGRGDKAMERTFEFHGHAVTGVCRGLINNTSTTET